MEPYDFPPPTVALASHAIPQTPHRLDRTDRFEIKSKRGSAPAITSLRESPLLLRLTEVIALTAMSRGTIINKVNAREFCQPIRMGVRSIRFVKSEVIAWIEERVKERDARKGGAQ